MRKTTMRHLMRYGFGLMMAVMLMATAPRAQTTDEAALRALSERYIAAYANRDLDAVLPMFSEKGPDFPVVKRYMQRLFKFIGKFTLKRLDVREVAVKGSEGRVLLTMVMEAVEARTGDTAAGYGKPFDLVLRCVKEEGQWKIWRTGDPWKDLAESLDAVKTKEERAALLAEQKALVTPKSAQFLIGAGHFFRVQGNYPAAIPRYKLALQIAEFFDDRAGVSDALNNIGTMYYLLGMYAPALESYRQCADRNQQWGDRNGQATALTYIGAVYANQGNYAKALAFYQQSLERVEDPARRADSLDRIGEVHLFQNSPDVALSFFQRSLAMRQRAGDPLQTAETLVSIANVYQEQGKLDAALPLYEQAQKAFQHSRDTLNATLALGDSANLHYRKGDYAKALELYRQTLTEFEGAENSSATASTLCSMADVLNRQENYAEALRTAERSAAIAERIGRPETLRRAYLAAGNAHRALGHPDQARPCFEKAIAAVETLRAQAAGGEESRQRFFEDKVPPYLAMVSLLVSEKREAEAFAYTERAKARVLLDVLQSGKANVTKTMTRAQQEQEQRLTTELTALNIQRSRANQSRQPNKEQAADLSARLEKARRDYEAFQTGLDAAHPELRAQRGQAKTLTVEEAGALLPDPKTALLEFVVLDRSVLLFVLTQGAEGEKGRKGEREKEQSQSKIENPNASLQVYTIDIAREELAKRVMRFRERLAKADPEFRQAARELYDLLLKPAQTRLQGRSSLVIVPDGVLWELPFQALVSEQNRYLLEDHALAYAPSLTALREMRRLRDRRPTSAAAGLLAFGNPALGRAAVSSRAARRDETRTPLPEAEKEVQQLRRLYGAARSRVYVGAEATEERAKAEAATAQVLHFAAHGILDDRSPLYSHVLLAQTERTETEDGLLEAWELMKMDVKADLAALSACETARGRVSSGEGVIGLSWALFVAGCPTTVVSQWSVESGSTTQLMVDFHRHRRAGRPTAEALREAALAMLRGEDRRYRHPFYWAGFVVVGDGR